MSLRWFICTFFWKDVNYAELENSDPFWHFFFLIRVHRQFMYPAFEISTCPIVRDNQFDRRTSKNISAVVRRTTIFELTQITLFNKTLYSISLPRPKFNSNGDNFRYNFCKFDRRTDGEVPNLGRDAVMHHPWFSFYLYLCCHQTWLLSLLACMEFSWRVCIDRRPNFGIYMSDEALIDCLVYFRLLSLACHISFWISFELWH